MVVQLTARPEHQGLRADRVVAELAAEAIEGSSRAAVQRWMKEGRITADTSGRRTAVDAKHKIVAGQIFFVDVPPPPASAALPEDDVRFTVVHVDDDVVVIDKPAGLVVHPAHGHAGGTLVNGLLGRGLFARELLEDGAAEHDRPGIVHRIDKDTSGLLVVARTPMAREHLKTQFAAHTIERVYAALALGNVDDSTFSTLHGRHPTDRVKFSSRVKEGKPAVTHVRRVQGFGGVATRVECRLETGRTHQIRVHLADAGHPLLGDALYGARPKSELARRAAETMGRQALHAGALGFEHPRTKAWLRFASEPPADFQAALAVLAGG